MLFIVLGVLPFMEIGELDLGEVTGAVVVGDGATDLPSN
jgi:hypothetical protein